MWYTMCLIFPYDSHVVYIIIILNDMIYNILRIQQARMKFYDGDLL